MGVKTNDSHPASMGMSDETDSPPSIQGFKATASHGVSPTIQALLVSIIR